MPFFPPVPPTGLGYGGATYGTSIYGGGALARAPYPPGGGYGGQGMGVNSYGSLDITPPRVSSAISLDGFRVEVFFSEEMRNNAALKLATNYVLTPTTGAPAVASLVTLGTAGSQGGYTSVIVTHSGTTLGGNYTIVVSNVEDMAGNPISGPSGNQASFYSYGDTAAYVIAATAGDAVRFQFKNSLGGDQDLLTEAEFTPGVEDTSSYSISTTYPIPLTIQTITHPVGADASKVDMTVQGMTSIPYDVLVSPASAIDYDGDVLPSAATGFTGVEVGTGTSTATVATGLLLTKNAGDLYGWAFEDSSGKVVPSASYRMDVVLNPAAGSYAPALYDAAVGTLSFSDGAVQVDLTFTKVGGVDVLNVSSGAYSGQVPATWSSGSVTVSLLRNQKADSYSVLVNGVPLVSQPSASFTGVPSINAGARLLLSATYGVAGFKVASVDVTSSLTVFTTSWNFLHSISGTFTGSSLLTNDRLLTDHGPLVKGWGDATPATKDDVEVRVNGTAVPIRVVNPYTGTIYPTTPIPLMPAAGLTVDVDYKWWKNPAFPLVALNTPGLVLNKWDQKRGHTAGVPSPLPPGHEGVADTSRFQMALGLPPQERPQPIEYGHRYMGFERDYSALLNSPTTLVLNRDPHRVSVPRLEDTCQAANVTFDGNSTPPQAEDPWTLEGVDSGSLQTDGTYLVVDASSGSYATGTAAAYYREEDFTCSSTVRVAGRLQVSSYVADGVFTGIAFGFHDNFRLYLAGLLEVNSLRHVGILTDAANPHLADSWEIGPSVTATITSSTTFTVPSASFPNTVDAGTHFQILSGNQAGTYTIAECGIDTYQGTVTVTLVSTTPFPADYKLYGNDTATVLFETPWDEQLTTLQLLATTDEDLADNRSAYLYVGGSLSGFAASVTADEVAAIPADTSLLIPTGEEGRVMWGSLSRMATNSAAWSISRYSIDPNAAVETLRGLVVAAEMSDPPEEDANHEWWITNGFGYAEIDSSGDTLLLKSTSGSSSLDLTYGYSRLEPMLTERVFCDCDAEFRVESGTAIGDATVRVRDDIRQASLVTLLYREGGTPYRALVELPSASLSGLRTPLQAGWLASTGNSLAEPVAHNKQFAITKASGAEGFWETAIAPTIYTGSARLIESRVAITSYVAGAGGNIGATWGAHAGSSVTAYDVRVTLKASPARVILTDSTGTEHGSFAFDWTDGDFHTYRVTADPVTDSVVLDVDDTVQGSVLLTAFGTSTDPNAIRIGAQGAAGASVAVYDSYSVQALPQASAKRTLGVLKGGGLDATDIDSYQIPRTDGLAVPNSDATAVVEEMDWTSYLRVRVHLDQTWGVSIYRPDIPPPPWFTGNFATQITDPTAAWINVEYSQLPRQPGSTGEVSFGALNPESVTQQRWKQVRYRLYNTPDEDYIAPQGMVLNRCNIIHSGEYNTDITPEVVTLTSLTSTLLSVRSAHMNADRVFSVVVDGSVVSSSTWSFDETTQLITLTTALPSDHYPATVTFAPGKPITTTYLCNQPFAQSVTKLNEGTPVMPLGQEGAAVSSVVFGSKINDPSDTLGDPDFILNDPYRSVVFSDPTDALYDDLTFCTVDNSGDTGRLSIACDNDGPVGMGLSGSLYWDQFSVPYGPAGPWGKGSPSIKGTQSSFPQSSVLHASGGSYVDGVLGPGTAVLFPNFPGEGQQGVKDSPVALSGMGLNQETKWRLTITTPYTEDFDIDGQVDDNTPPSSPDPDLDPNPDGTPGLQAHGACAARLTDYAPTTDADRLGPWGGLASLSKSLLGGGAQLDGNELTLNGGAVIPGPTVTDFQIEAAN